MEDFTEKRKYKRIELDKWKYKEIVSPCIARFRVKQICNSELPPPDWNIVAVKNLSAGGIKMNYYKENLEVDSLIDIKIEFIKSISAINCTGRVVRIERTPYNSMFRIAAEFMEIDKNEREIINATVEAILRKETKRRIYSEKLLKMKNSLSLRSRIAETKTIGVANVEKMLKNPKYETVSVSGTNKLQEEKADELSVITEAKRKDVEKALKNPKNKPVSVSGANKLHEEKAGELSVIAETKRKAVEKALKKIKYEPVCASDTNKLREEKTDESSDIKETHRKAVLGKEGYDYHAKSRERIQKKSPATALIIAYMALMVTLGFIVHRDLTKQLNRVEAKLNNVVSKVDYSGF